MTTRQFNRAMMAAIFGSGLACLATGQARAAVIVHNNGFISNNLELPGYPNYASRVNAADLNWSVHAGVHGIVGAPNISLLWHGTAEAAHTDEGFETYTNWDGRTAVIQLDSRLEEEDAVGVQFTIAFTPDAGFGVRLDSFDLDAWAGSGGMHMSWAVTGSSSGVMAAGDWMREAGRDTINLNLEGVIGETLTLTFVHLAGDPAYVAMDNLAFDQLVPEPASAALVAAGLGAMAMRRRRSA